MPDPVDSTFFYDDDLNFAVVINHPYIQTFTMRKIRKTVLIANESNFKSKSSQVFVATLNGSKRIKFTLSEALQFYP